MRFVLDASVTLAWCFEDAASSIADYALGILGSGGQAVVPSLWRLELANGLVMAERRQRMTEADTTRFLCLLEGLPIEVISDYRDAASMVTLARAHGLTAYDAAYLEVALRTGVPLATLDGQLSRAAKAAGVTVMIGDA
jgi:predicted nucleic acid-binding protein